MKYYTIFIVLLQSFLLVAQESYKGELLINLSGEVFDEYIYSDNLFFTFNESENEVVYFDIENNSKNELLLNPDKKLKLNFKGSIFHNFKRNCHYSDGFWQLGLVQKKGKPYILSIDIVNKEVILNELKISNLLNENCVLYPGEKSKLSKSTFEQVLVNTYGLKDGIGIYLYGHPWVVENETRHLVSPCLYIKKNNSPAILVKDQIALCNPNGGAYRFYPFTIEGSLFFLDESTCTVYDENHELHLSLSKDVCEKKISISTVNDCPILQYIQKGKIELIDLKNGIVENVVTSSKYSELIGIKDGKLIIYEPYDFDDGIKGLYLLDNNISFLDDAEKISIAVSNHPNTLLIEDNNNTNQEETSNIVILSDILNQTICENKIDNAKELISHIDNVLSRSKNLSKAACLFAVTSELYNEVPYEVWNTLANKDWEGLDNLIKLFNNLHSDFENIEWDKSEKDRMIANYNRKQIQILINDGLFYFDALIEL